MRFALEKKGTGVRLHGVARKDRKTKQLVKRIQPNEIAVIQHVDLDEVAADALIATKVQAVINTAPSISGRYPNLGPLKLVRAGVFLLDEAPAELMQKLTDGQIVSVIDNLIVLEDAVVGKAQVLDEELILARMAKALVNVRSELRAFVENTLTYAQQEKNFFLGDLPKLDMKTKMSGRHVLVVVRGPTYKEDLRAIATYIRDVKPVLIGVDGGADALVEAGFRPDLIVGDMDSVSDAGLRSGAELIVHAYADGRAPGLVRIETLKLQAHVYPAPGTSEDVAMLLAHEYGAELIVALGTHSNMIDFLEKGRRGMASTVLTRMRIGNKLVDAKGVSQLYCPTIDWRAACLIVGAASVPLGVAAWLNPLTRSFLKMVYLNVRLFVT
ncbi:thiamin pyrophosphokinase [Tumebacillus algifaecis]|uniref:Thiamin pyrophosphokinase n=1 Tax=Tumebacillus algifaecis TaxID=1214604 RepID=A0A223CZU8_9BACL|nr:putative cytokinetic ring protein SteA [Tumebacillus algifaecis]ASS74999.1 thiamin pyrophosphokinase [Tumebacillus algifaecis]